MYEEICYEIQQEAQMMKEWGKVIHKNPGESHEQ